MPWLIAAPIILIIALVVFVIATDGRYFGKGLIFWLYDHAGPSIFASRSEQPLWRDLADALRLSGGESILDVGTAVGDLPLGLASLPRFSGRVVGIDWSPRMIEQAGLRRSHGILLARKGA